MMRKTKLLLTKFLLKILNIQRIRKLYERAVIETPLKVLVHATAEFENSSLELKQADLNFLEQIVIRENEIQEKKGFWREP